MTWGTGSWGGTGLWGSADASLPVVTFVDPICGSRHVPLDQVIEFNVNDPRTVGGTLGIDLTLTTVTVRIGANPVETVFIGGVFTANWLGSSTAAVGQGYDFDLVYFQDFPESTVIRITVDAYNLDGMSAEWTCAFTTIALPKISSIDVISLRTIRVNFNQQLKRADISPALTTLSNWSIRPISGNAVHDNANSSQILRVMPQRIWNPLYVFLSIRKMVAHQRYEVSVKDVEDIFHQVTVGNNTVAFEARRTKVDAMFEGLPPAWSVDQFTDLAWYMTAIAYADEVLGGAQGVIQTGALRRLF
jgi:hypothetical protein